MPVEGGLTVRNVLSAFRGNFQVMSGRVGITPVGVNTLRGSSCDPAILVGLLRGTDNILPGFEAADAMPRLLRGSVLWQFGQSSFDGKRDTYEGETTDPYAIWQKAQAQLASFDSGYPQRSKYCQAPINEYQMLGTSFQLLSESTIMGYPGKKKSSATRIDVSLWRKLGARYCLVVGKVAKPGEDGVNAAFRDEWGSFRYWFFDEQGNLLGTYKKECLAGIGMCTSIYESRYVVFAGGRDVGEYTAMSGRGDDYLHGRVLELHLEGNRPLGYLEQDIGRDEASIRIWDGQSSREKPTDLVTGEKAIALYDSGNSLLRQYWDQGLHPFCHWPSDG